MKLNTQTPKQSLNKAFLKQPVNRDDITLFKANLQTLRSKINENETDEHHKNFVRDFLKDTSYKTNYEINTKGRQYLLIHVGKDASDKVGVILEAKKPTNKADMISAENPNRKANLSKFIFIAFLILFCVLFSNAQQTDNSNKSENKTGKNAKNQDEANGCPNTGVVRLKVTFDKSSKVTNVEMISSAGCKFCDEKAVKAAKELKFTPAKKNGKNITQVKIVEYSFTITD